MLRMIAQKFIDWIKSLFSFIHQNGNTTEIGGNLEVDGNAVINGDTTITPQTAGTISNDTTIFTSSSSAYKTVEKIGNVLWLIIEDEITAVSSASTFTYVFNFSSSISHYIIRRDRTDLTTEPSTIGSILGSLYCYNDTLVKECTLVSDHANTAYLNMQTPLVAGTSYKISLRIPLVLI